MRFIVYGAGAIGGLTGARMAEAGQDVVLIARGAHAEAIRADGLTIESADGSRSIDVPVAEGPSEAGISDGDVVILAMKSHDTWAALDALRVVAPPSIPVVCLQNGVANERAALRRYHHVQAVCVMCPAGHLEPGVVEQHSVPIPGLLDVGRYPAGVDATTTAVATALRGAGFESVERPDVMRWKYRKLLTNLGNAVQALCTPPGRDRLTRQAQAEGEACLQAAGIDCASREEDRERRGDLLAIREIAGRGRAGSSTWQSLRRGTGSIESDYLNGEVALLGRLHGIPTPVNDVLQELAIDAARRREAPGAHTVEEIEARLRAGR